MTNSSAFQAISYCWLRYKSETQSIISQNLQVIRSALSARYTATDPGIPILKQAKAEYAKLQ